MWPKSWTNIEVRFVVEEISLDFQCDDKAVGWFRVTVLDQNLEEVVYIEGANSDDTTLDVGFNIQDFPDPLLREMFQMARCKREHKRTDDIQFARKFEHHRSQLVGLWDSVNRGIR